jgi:hypothetical protein
MEVVNEASLDWAALQSAVEKRARADKYMVRNCRKTPPICGGEDNNLKRPK